MARKNKKTKKGDLDYRIREIAHYSDLADEVNGLPLDDCLNNLWMGLGDVRYLKLNNPFLEDQWEDHERIPELTVRVCRDPEYLHFFCKYVLGINLQPFQLVILQTLWYKPFPLLIASRGSSKSFLLAIYLVLRMLLHPGCSIAVVGAALRQSMVIFNYVLRIYDEAPILRDIAPEHPKRGLDMCSWMVGSSKAVFLPLGNGDKIRGQRANVILVDETASLPIEVFETVVRGFAAVRSEGVSFNVAQAYREKLFDQLGIKGEQDIKPKTIMASNQIIMAGTPSYQFNHFYKYYCTYRDIILSGGDLSKMPKEYEEMGDGRINSQDYAIIRIPYDQLPLGMMDEKVLMQGKATMDPQIFMAEYGGVFPADSDGFFLATWIHKVTCPVNIDGTTIDFPPKLYGERDLPCVMGVDPASEDDRFTINIIQMMGSIRGVVYQWSTDRKEFEKMKKDGIIAEDIHDYMTFCVKHIRSLCRRFPIKMIVLDAGGGGVSIREGLKNPAMYVSTSDEPILDMDDENSMGLIGNRMLKMIEFSSSEWRRNAHHGLQKDIINSKLLFPSYDPAELEGVIVKDRKAGKAFDTFEDCYYEIEQCKQETILIRHTATANGTERWDVPKVVGLDAENVRRTLKRDRFTSLLLANWGCRLLEDDKQYDGERFLGGVAGSKNMTGLEGFPYVGPGVGKLKNFGHSFAGSVQSASTNFGNGRRILY